MEKNAPKTAQIKVVLLGDSGSYLSYPYHIGVGKSSIMLRFVAGTFSERSEATLGGAFMAKMYNYQNISLKYQVQNNYSLNLRYGIQLVKKNIML